MPPIPLFSNEFHWHSYSVTGTETEISQKFGESDVGAVLSYISSYPVGEVVS